jgi:hypothetical protein
MQLPPSSILIKRAVYFLVICIAAGLLGKLIQDRNPNVQKAQGFLYQSAEVASITGKIEKANLWKTISLQGGTHTSGETFNSYDEYQFGIQGSSGNFVAVIKAEDSREGERNVFSVKSIKKK